MHMLWRSFRLLLLLPGSIRDLRIFVAFCGNLLGARWWAWGLIHLRRSSWGRICGDAHLHFSIPLTWSRWCMGGSCEGWALRIKIAWRGGRLTGMQWRQSSWWFQGEARTNAVEQGPFWRKKRRKTFEIIIKKRYEWKLQNEVAMSAEGKFQFHGGQCSHVDGGKVQGCSHYPNEAFIYFHLGCPTKMQHSNDYTSSCYSL